MLVKINGCELCYTIHGRGRPMLLLPDGPGRDCTYFRPWLDGLGEQVQLIYFDYEGDERLAGVEGLRVSLGYERIILLGHAYGSLSAQEYALDYGDRLSGLILCSPNPTVGEAHLNQLSELVTPTLVIAGRQDTTLTLWQAECLHALLPHSTLVIFDQSDRLPFSQEHDKFLAVIAAWISGLD